MFAVKGVRFAFDAQGKVHCPAGAQKIFIERKTMTGKTILLIVLPRDGFVNSLCFRSRDFSVSGLNKYADKASKIYPHTTDNPLTESFWVASRHVGLKNFVKTER